MIASKHKKQVGKAQILSDNQQDVVIAYLEKHSKHAIRDICMFLLTIKAGLRAVEVAQIEWWMILNPEKTCISDEIYLPRAITKGQRVDRTIPTHKLLKKYLTRHFENDKPMAPNQRVFYSERGRKFSRFVMVGFFWRLYKKLGFYKCSSHSGRRTFVTMAARNITRAGGSLKEIQDMVGHSSLATTQEYIQINKDAKRKVIDMI